MVKSQESKVYVPEWMFVSRDSNRRSRACPRDDDLAQAEVPSTAVTEFAVVVAWR